MDGILEPIFNGILDGNQRGVAAGVQAALDKGYDPEKVLKEAMIAAMQEVGRLFEEGEYFVPEMLVAARAMQGGLAILKPHLIQANIASSGKVIAGTVKGDLHRYREKPGVHDAGRGGIRNR